MIEELQVLGLTKNEAAVYEALVKTGTTKAGALIARLDIHRNIVYGALESLIHKGFATKISKRGVWHFQITEPDSIATMLRQRQQIADEVITQVKSYKHHIQQQITVYEGLESFRAYWINSLERFPEGTVDYTLGVPDHGRWRRLMGPAFDIYMELRKRKRLVWKTILTKLSAEEQQLYTEAPELTEYRLWEKNFTPIGNFNVIGDTVILQVMEESNPRIIEIRDLGMVTVFMNYFAAIWEDSKPIKFSPTIDESKK